MSALAQNNYPGRPRQAGIFYASAYGTGQGFLIAGNVSTGTSTVIIAGNSAGGAVQLIDGETVPINIFFKPSVLAALTFSDSNLETVTPISVSIAPCPPSNINAGGSTQCATFTGPFTKTHGQMVVVKSGTFGLQEAINAATASGGGNVVVDSSWGGTTSMITSAAGNSTVSIEDNRSGNIHYVWNGSTYIGGSSLTNPLATNLDFGTSNATVLERANSATGTSLNKLAKLVVVGSTTQAQVATTSDTQGVTGCVVGGAGTSGNAQIATFGVANCFYDNTPTTAGDFVIVSTVTGGTLNDAGSSFPSSVEVLGKVLDTHGACGAPPCGPYATLFLTPDTSGGAGAPNWAVPGTIGSTTPNTGLFTTVNKTCLASTQAGSDVGTQINNCETLLGSAPGEIWVSGGGNIAVAAAFSHNLRVIGGHSDVYTCSVDTSVFQACWEPKSGATMKCDDWGTTLQESTHANSWFVISPYNASQVGTSTDSNVRVTGCHIKGANGVTNSTEQAFEGGNCHNCSFDHNWIDTTNAIGAQFGGGSSTGNFAQNCSITDNLFTNVASQTLALVNARGCHVKHNKIIPAGISGGPGFVPIDLETNTALDTLIDNEVVDNIIDITTSGNASIAHGIEISGNGAVNGGNTIINNSVIGAGYTATLTSKVNACFFAANVSDLTIQGNYCHGAQYGVWTVAVDNAVISGNHFDQVEFGGQIDSTTNTRVLNNDSYCNQAGNNASWSACFGIWFELNTFSGSDFNTYDGNSTYVQNHSTGMVGNIPGILGAHDVIVKNYDLYYNYQYSNQGYNTGSGTSKNPGYGFGAENYNGLGLYRGANGQLNINGTPAIAGSLQVTALPTPAAPQVFPTGTTGGTTYSYKLVYLDALGNHTAVSSITTVANGNASLSSSNYNDIFFGDGADTVHCAPGVASADVYRTVGGATQGKIGNLLCNDLSFFDSTRTESIAHIKDTGLAGDGNTAPTVNTTGVETLGGVVESAPPAAAIHGVCKGVATANNTNGVAVTNLGGDPTVNTCIGSTGVQKWGTVLTHACVLRNFYVNAGTAGKDATDAVMTLQDNATSLSLACTVGSGTACHDTNQAHNAVAAAGDMIWVKGSTEAATTLADVSVSVDCQ